MKNLAFFCAAIIVVSCSERAPEMKGAYKMMWQNVKGDTTDITNTNPQLKLYTEEYMMYANYNPADSARAFGICAYIVSSNDVIESAIYSAANTTVSDSTQNYSLSIEQTNKGYKQVINGIAGSTGEKFILTEEYETISSDKTSPLDGAWVLTSASMINEKGETVPVSAIAYKTYYAGSFMFGNTALDSMKVSHANVGFGTFEMNGDNTASETIQTSSYLDMVGQTFALALKWNGPDEFSQTIIGENGNVSSTETYKRLGK